MNQLKHSFCNHNCFKVIGAYCSNKSVYFLQFIRVCKHLKENGCLHYKLY